MTWNRWLLNSNTADVRAYAPGQFLKKFTSFPKKCWDRLKDFSWALRLSKNGLNIIWKSYQTVAYKISANKLQGKKTYVFKALFFDTKPEGNVMFDGACFQIIYTVSSTLEYLLIYMLYVMGYKTLLKKLLNIFFRSSFSHGVF